MRWHGSRRPFRFEYGLFSFAELRRRPQSLFEATRAFYNPHSFRSHVMALFVAFVRSALPQGSSLGVLSEMRRVEICVVVQRSIDNISDNATPSPPIVRRCVRFAEYHGVKDNRLRGLLPRRALSALHEGVVSTSITSSFRRSAPDVAPESGVVDFVAPAGLGASRGIGVCMDCAIGFAACVTFAIGCMGGIPGVLFR